MIKFGAWSMTLAIGSLHGLVMAGLLWRTRANRAANRWLAGLLGVVVLMITPYTLGYAGFYDAYPWLTFAPFFWQLAIGPFLWLYVRQLGSHCRPSGWGWHFVPAALQGAYYLTLFCLPLETRWRWDAVAHSPWVAPAEHVLILASIVLYLVAALRRHRDYQRWLVGHSAAREEWHLAWLRRLLLAMAAVTAVAALFGAAPLFYRRLDYFDEFPLYLVFTALAWYLGVEGWRHADRPFPPGFDAAEEALPAPVPPVPPPAEAAAGPKPERDWAALAERVRHAVGEGRWWREPDLELAELARRIGTNTNYLSRALNDGLGMSFSEFINRQRVAAAQVRLETPGDVLEIAFDVGFRSKASFNRAFKSYVGESPTAWRERCRDGATRAGPEPRLES